MRRPENTAGDTPGLRDAMEMRNNWQFSAIG